MAADNVETAEFINGLDPTLPPRDGQRSNGDDILRLIATIKLKETTASDIFRRLNSYAKQHVLYRAIKAFGQIIKSLFILRYLDDLTLRQAVEQQLTVHTLNPI